MTLRPQDFTNRLQQELRHSTLRRMLGKAPRLEAVREVPRIKSVKVFPRDRMVTVDDENDSLAASPRPLKDVLTIMLDSGLRNGEVSRMRLENINWIRLLFHPRGKTRKARRPVPLSERLSLCSEIFSKNSRVKERVGYFPSKKTRSGHIGLSDSSTCSERSLVNSGSPDALKRIVPGTRLDGRNGGDAEIRDWSRKSWGTRAWIRRWAICIRDGSDQSGN